MKTIIDFTNKVKSLVDGRISNIANVEESPSTHAYTVGKQLIFNGLLCKATSAIAVGDTLAVGTNLTLSDNVVEQIYSLNQGLTNSLADMNNVLGAKNLLKNELVSGTVAGVTYTKNSDGSITCSNTATDLSYKAICEFVFKAGVKYILSGCPSGGSASTHFLQAFGDGLDRKDLGSGSTIQVSSDTTATIRIVYINGQTADETFYPMLRPASIEDDTYIPYSMTNREMTPYVQAISNPNLLDNPWFTVNQRGQSSFPSVNYAYWMDRWRVLGKNSETIGRTITLDDGISVSAGTGMEPGDIVCQVLEKERFQFEKVYTLSVMLDDGKVYSVSGILPTPDGTYKIPIFTVVSGKILIRVTEELNKNIGVIASAERDNISFKIKAMKLELGSVSTLAMDTAPNYATELAKCQRYFVRFGSNESVPAYTYNFGMAYEVNSSSAYFNVMIPIPMRSTPLISYQGSWAIGSKALNNITVNSMINNIVKLVCTTSQTFTAGEIELLENKEAGINYIDFSADL